MPQNALPTRADNNNRAALRKLLLSQRYCIGSDDRQEREAELVKRIVHEIKQYDPRTVVAIYMPHAGEPNVLGLASLISNPLCLPVVVNKGEPLQFAQWQAGDALMNDRYGIPTPIKHAWLRPQLLLIPCVGYTEGGFRLGYGGGYYDRTLEALSSSGPVTAAVGVAWSQASCVFRASEHDVALAKLVLA